MEMFRADIAPRRVPVSIRWIYQHKIYVQLKVSVTARVIEAWKRLGEEWPDAEPFIIEP